MAKDKKSFLLYSDQQIFFEQLPDDLAGKVVKHLFRYVNDENPPEDDLLLKLAFAPIKRQLKNDLKEWEQIKQKRSAAGKASARAREKKKIQHKATNSTHVESVENISTNPTVKVKCKSKVKEKRKFIPPSLKEFGEYAKAKWIEQNNPWSDDVKYLIKNKYDYWAGEGWKDYNGKPIKNWKTKITNQFIYFKKLL